MFFEQFNKLCRDNGTTPTEFVKNVLDLSSSKVTAWKNGSIPKYVTLQKIAEYFNVPVGALFDGNNGSITCDETELLNNYRIVDEIAKAQIRERAAVLAEQAAAKSNAVKIALKQSQTADKIAEPDTEIEYIYLDLPELSASAGTGEYLHSDYADKLRVPATNLTSRADYALRVHGDSMEPRFHDGDIVLVAADAEVREGDIGIFILNGEGYIKQKGDKRLISLNNKYKDIKIGSGDTCICRGKVIGSL